ncbi:MAG: DUF2997 domain-containing protein [Prevotella sp.]|nr:DUF2997 domain-containing protein [Prevotella sp.]
MARQIQIRIFPDGRIEAETKNIKGKQCLKYLLPLEQLLDAKIVDSDFTSEYYETEMGETNTEELQVNN